PVNSGGFLGAPTPPNNGVLESNEPAAAAATAPAAGAPPTAPVAAPGPLQGNGGPAAATAGAQASKQLLLKAGSRLEGELRENYGLNGRGHNDWLF
ncbi:hypothetical protein QMO30_26985, partial [Klebsiella pneumoniae]|nr:hypothetical protein [Klebsiella pneumoniae]